MGVWAELVGVRRGLRLKTKWFHHVAIGFAVLSSMVVYIVVNVAVVLLRPPKMNASNTYSLTLLHHALGRATTTTITDLADLPGTIATVGAHGEILPVKVPPGIDPIRCERQPQFKANQIVRVADVTYRAIPDHPGQVDAQLRHCIATEAYAHLTAESIAVYTPDGSERRHQENRALFAGVAAVCVWLVLYWNVYYRGLIPFYARYRRMKRHRRFHAHHAR